MDRSLSKFYLLKEENILILELLKSRLVELLARCGCILMTDTWKESQDASEKEYNAKVSELVASALAVIDSVEEEKRVMLLSMIGKALAHCNRYQEAHDHLWNAYNICMEADENADFYEENIMSRVFDILTLQEQWGKLEEAVIFGSCALKILNPNRVSADRLSLLRQMNDDFCGRLLYTQSHRFQTQSLQMLSLLQRRSLLSGDVRFDRVFVDSPVIDLGTLVGPRRSQTIAMQNHNYVQEGLAQDGDKMLEIKDATPNEECTARLEVINPQEEAKDSVYEEICEGNQVEIDQNASRKRKATTENEVPGFLNHLEEYKISASGENHDKGNECETDEISPRKRRASTENSSDFC